MVGLRFVHVLDPENGDPAPRPMDGTGPVGLEKTPGPNRSFEIVLTQTNAKMRTVSITANFRGANRASARREAVLERGSSREPIVDRALRRCLHRPGMP
jgi:hypothetical protein